MAKVVQVANIIELGEENQVKLAGKTRQQGETDVVEGGDVILFKFTAGDGKK